MLMKPVKVDSANCCVSMKVTPRCGWDRGVIGGTTVIVKCVLVVSDKFRAGGFAGLTFVRSCVTIDILTCSL